MNKRVKIVATLGPAVEIRGGKKFGEDGYWGEKLDVEASAQNIAKLIEAGANTFRFNFSHGDHQEQGERMATVKRAEEIAGKKVGFLLDTKGPEIRTELFEGEAKEYSYKTGEKIRVATKQGIKSTRDVIALNVAGGLDIYDDVEVGRQVLVDDGKLGLRVVAKDDATREFEVEVENDGIIAKQKGVAHQHIESPEALLPALEGVLLMKVEWSHRQITDGWSETKAITIVSPKSVSPSRPDYESIAAVPAKGEINGRAVKSAKVYDAAKSLFDRLATDGDISDILPSQ